MNVYQPGKYMKIGENMILDTIAAATRRRVETAKKELPIAELKVRLAEADVWKNTQRVEEKLHDRDSMVINVTRHTGREEFIFEKALKKEGISFICEVKKASPSKGIIAEDFPYLQIAQEYEQAGADAISVLTEPDYFKGSNTYLTEISKKVKVPVLRKDFTIDEYQLYEAKLIGADAVLLICSLLPEETIRHYLILCEELRLSALVEAHTEEEVKSAVRAGARIIGVNNRNLQTFEVDINNSIRLRSFVPEEILYVAESGIQTNEDIMVLQNAGVDAVLIGETLMRSANKKEMLNSLRG